MSRPMKDSGIAWIGQVPEHWTVAPVRSVLKEVTAKNIFGKETTALQFRYGTIVEKDNFDATEDEYVARTIRNYTLIYPGVLVLNGLNLNYDFVTKRVALSRLKGAITSAYMTITPIDTHVLMPEFVEYLFKSYDAKMAFHGMGEGVRKILNFNELKRQPIIYPTYTEQKRIVQVLDKKCAEIDTLSNSIQKQIDSLEQYKRAVITETVTKGLNPSAPMKDSGIPWIGQIPAHWNLLPLRYWIISRQSGAWGDNEQQNENDHFCVRVADFDYDTYQLKDGTPTTLRNYTQQTVNLLALKKDDILIEKSGGGEKTPVGRSIIIRKDFDSPTLFANFVERIRIKPMYCAMYVEYALVAFYKQGLSTFYFQQTTGIQNLNITKMFRMESIPCPSLHEQRAIADYLDDKCGKIGAIIQDKQQQLEKLEQYKKATIFEYVTGKKQVPEV